MASAAENITRAFAGDWHGSYGTIPTPDHSKRDRGTTVKDGDGGDVVFASFNGGDWRELKDECRRRGLLPDRERANDNGGWREAGCYEYVNADGTVASRQVRQEKAGQRKRFVGQRPDGRGGWLNGLGDAPRILYRLPELLAADPASVVYLVEGERKADKLASWGLVATACANGARGWRDSYAETLAGRTVAILPDNDDEGRGFAERAAASIRKAGGRVVMVELPGLPAKGDVIDWSGSGGSAFELEALTEAALNPPVETFPIADLAAWAAVPPEPKRFAMAGLIPEREVTLFTGPGGTNKSTFGLQICACAAAGLPLLGVPVAAGPAVFITAEDEDRENHWRTTKIAAAVNTPLERLAGKLHVVSLRGRLNNELATFDHEGRLQVAPAYRLLRATIEATGSKLVVLDNVGHLFVGNENDRGQVTAFINLLYQLCRELDVTILLIGHPNKQFLQGSKEGNATSGSTAWLNAVRSHLVIERPEGNRDPDARVVRLEKANYSRPDQQLAFLWSDFALIREDELPAERRAERASVAQAGAENEAFLTCLAKATADRRAVSHVKGSNYAPTIFAGMVEANGTTAAAFAAALERLLHLGAIRLDQALWQDAHRHWKQGIKLASECGDPPAATPCGDLRQPTPQTGGNAAATLRAATPLYTTYNGGAAHGSAAPPAETWNGNPALGRTRPGMILAPGETGYEPVPGFEDLPPC